MNGEELKQLRHDLAKAIGRPISRADMAKVCGLAPKNGADTIRKWEEGANGPSGPVAALLSILAFASPDYRMRQEFFYDIRWIDGRELDVGPEVASSVVRRAMRAEILRRIS